MRYLVGRDPKMGWGVFDKQDGWVTGFFATKQEAMEVAMYCEQHGRPQQDDTDGTHETKP